MEQCFHSPYHTAHTSAAVVEVRLLMGADAALLILRALLCSVSTFVPGGRGILVLLLPLSMLVDRVLMDCMSRCTIWQCNNGSWMQNERSFFKQIKQV